MSKVTSILASWVLLVLVGCGDQPGAQVYFADLSGVTPSGVTYTGRKCTLLEAGAEYYSMVMVAQGAAIKVASSSATGMSIRLASNQEIEAVFGQSVVVAGARTETVPNGPDYESTVKLLEQALDGLLAPASD